LEWRVEVNRTTTQDYPIQSVKPHENQKLTLTLKAPLKMEQHISREKAPGFKKMV